jgi:hypothetical protein
VVFHHGRQERRRSKPRRAAVCFNSLLGGALNARSGAAELLAPQGHSSLIESELLGGVVLNRDMNRQQVK